MVGDDRSQENPGLVPFPSSLRGFVVEVFVDSTTSIPSSSLEGCWVGILALGAGTELSCQPTALRQKESGNLRGSFAERLS